jgi:signal transduction histidine kinase
VRHSLRFRALALVFVFNAAVFAALGVVLVRAHMAERDRAEERFTRDLVATIQDTIRPEGLKVLGILRWPSWHLLEDAILVDSNLVTLQSGAVVSTGIDLNPVGASHREPAFPRERVLGALQESMRESRTVSVLGGRAIPVHVPGGAAPWGGLWYRPRESYVPDLAGMVVGILPWFALSTVLLTLATFEALRRLVLDPVGQLAEGARRLREGDFEVRLSDSPRRDELADLVRSFNEMTSTVAGFNERLSAEVRVATEKARAAEAAAMRERRLAAMGELAAGIAHEINNPLGGLLNALRDLGREDLPPERRTQYLGLLERGLERIGETVNRLRRFTPREGSLETVELAAVARDAIELVQHRARRAGVQLLLVGEDRRARVTGSRNELGQAVLNLLVNALDALEGEPGRRGRVEVTLERRDDGPRLCVRDNGPGVAAEELRRVGDLFYTTKEVGRGTGLGLALVGSTMRHHGGHMNLSSQPGRGFEVELVFPPPGGGDPS